jgi:hypothetical protein
MAAAATVNATTRWRNIYTTWDKTANAAVSDINRWGIPAPTFRVEKLGDKLSTYVDMGLVMSTLVPDLLKTHFLDNGAPRTAAPMLLFASENRFRSVTLGAAGYATPNASGVAIDFAPAGQDQQTVVTIASLSWAPYRYSTAGSRWESYPFAEYWDLLELRLKESSAFGDGATEDDRIIGEGMRLIAKSYFTYLYHGRANLVQSDATPLGLLDSSAALYLSLQERTDAAFDVADDISTATGTASLINIVVQPLAQNLMKEFSLRRFQLDALANPKTRDVMQQILASGLAPFDTTYRGALRNTFQGLGDDLNQSFVQGVKLGSRSRHRRHHWGCRRRCTPGHCCGDYRGGQRRRRRGGCQAGVRRDRRRCVGGHVGDACPRRARSHQRRGRRDQPTSDHRQ